MALLKVSTAYTVMFPMVSSTDHLAALTGATVTVNISKAGAAFAAAGGTVTEVANGWYKCALTTTDTNTLGDLAFHCTATGADPTQFKEQVVSFDTQDAAALGLSRLDAAVTSRASATDYTTGRAANLDNLDALVSSRLASTALVTQSGTAQAGAASTVTLASGASATTDLYVGQVVVLTGSTGAGQARVVTAYNGSTKVATVDRAWATNPSATSTYVVIGLEQAKLDASLQVTAASVQGNVTGSVASVTGAVGSVTAGVTVTTNNDKTGYTASTVQDKTGYGLATLDSPVLQSGTAQAGAASTITLASGASATDSLYVGCVVKVYGGTGAGQARAITGYVGATKVATVDRSWSTNPDATSTYAVLATDGAKLDASLQTTAASVQGNVTGSVGSVTGAVGSVTGAVTVGTNNDKTGYALSAAAVQAIWDALTSALTTVGSVGKRIADDLDATISSRLASASYTAPPSAASVSTQVWSEAIPGSFTAGQAGSKLNSASSAGDPWSTAVPGAYGAGTAGKILGTNLDATVSSRSSHTAADVWASVTRSLTDKAGFSLSAAGVQAIWDALTSALTTASSVGKLLVDKLDATVSSRSSHTAADAWDVAISSHVTTGSTGAKLQAAGAGAGAGAITFTYTLTRSDNALPIADAEVWVTTRGQAGNVVASGRTNTAGQIVFALDAGLYDLYRAKAGFDFNDPDQVTVS